MNTIRSTRRRPRVRSVNFRALWWVLIREATLRAVWPWAIGSLGERAARAALVSIPTDTLKLRVRRSLKHRPDRRNY